MKDITRIPVHRFQDGSLGLDAEDLASECLVHLYVNNRHLTSLLASPENLGDLATGHLRTEYGIDMPHGGHAVREDEHNGAYLLHLNVDGLAEVTSRSNVVTTSCGGCEQDRLTELVEQTPTVTCDAVEVPIDRLLDALEQMRSQQHGFAKTGGMHAAGLLFSSQDGLLVREDIGRHNAVDKVIGAYQQSASSASPTALLLSGRCGWDIVAKAASMNIPVIASIGAASSLAVKTARSSNMTLVSFAKAGRAVVIGPLEGRIQRNH